MTTPTTPCAKCGRPITFVRIRGKICPLHVDRKPCRPAVSKRDEPQLPLPIIFAPAFDNPVISRPCRCSAAPSVIIVHHKDGVLRFDRVEWPWKRHCCDSTLATDYGLDFLTRRLSEQNLEGIRLGLVAGAKRFCEDTPFYYVAVLECANTDNKLCLKVRCDPETAPSLAAKARVIPGELVAITGLGPTPNLCTLSGHCFHASTGRYSPEELDIPAEWMGDGVRDIRI